MGRGREYGKLMIKLMHNPLFHFTGIIVVRLINNNNKKEREKKHFNNGSQGSILIITSPPKLLLARPLSIYNEITFRPS